MTEYRSVGVRLCGAYLRPIDSDSDGVELAVSIKRLRDTAQPLERL